MTSFHDFGDDAVLRSLGGRLARRRLDRDLTQAQLGARAGVARGAVQRIELGDSVTTTTLVRVLRALDALDDLDAAIPERGPSPLGVLRSEGQVRRRASGRRGKPKPPPRSGEFRWGNRA